MGIRSSVSSLDHDAAVDEVIDFFQGARLFKNLFSETDTLVQRYNDVFDKLLQEFHYRAAGDTLVVVHRIWEDLTKFDDLRESFSKYPLSHCLISEMQVTR